MPVAHLPPTLHHIAACFAPSRLDFVHRELEDANKLIAYLKKESDLHMGMVQREQSEALFVKNAGELLTGAVSGAPSSCFGNGSAVSCGFQAMHWQMMRGRCD